MDNDPGGFMARVMRRAGYVPAARARELRERNVELKQALKAAQQQLDTLKKHKLETLQKERDRADRTQQEREDAKRKLQDRLEKLGQKTEHEVRRLREHDVTRAARLDDLQQRTAWAEKSIQLGREHLMAIEVKLDIVEGAINVLDQRTRAALAAARGDHDRVRDAVRLS